jgi:pyruvate dehydrogenase E1 component
VLGTDGFGLSESRADLRGHFEVSAPWITYAALATLADCDRGSAGAANDYAVSAGLDLSKADPRKF